MARETGSDSAPETRRVSVGWARGRQHVAVTGSGHAVVIDSPVEKGGGGSGPSNTELLLSALGGCSGMDVVNILRKMRLTLDDLRIEVEGELGATEPRRLERVRMLYLVWGPDVRPEAVERAIRLSHERHCIIGNTLRPTVDITWEYQINPPGRAARSLDPPPSDE